MPTLSAADLNTKQVMGGAYGHTSVESFEFAVAGVANADLLQIGRIPAGSEVPDMKLVFDDCGTSVTLSLGYAPVVVADGPAAVANYWIAAGLDVATAAGASRSNAHSIRFDRDVYITATIGGANFTGTPKLSAVATLRHIGVK